MAQHWAMLTNFNAEWARNATRWAGATGTNVGSPSWEQAALPKQPWYTGYHGSEGWRHLHKLMAPDAMTWCQLVLSQYAARPDKYIGSSKREIGYGIGGRPYPWSGEPLFVNDLADGGYVYPLGQVVYGIDSEHFLAQPLFEVATKQTGLTPMANENVLDGSWEATQLTFPIRDWAVALVQNIQNDGAGQMALWLTDDLTKWGSGPPSDRTASRAIDALMMSAKIVGLDGANATFGTAFVTRWIQELATNGHPLIYKDPATLPSTGQPVWNPVHAYGYGIPVLYWLTKWFAGSLSLADQASIELILSQDCAQLEQLVGTDGSFPWAVNQAGVVGYSSWDGKTQDKTVWGPSIYTALRVAQARGSSKCAVAASAILGSFAKNPLATPWLCDIDRNQVTL